LSTSNPAYLNRRAEINPTPTPDDIEPTKVSRNWRIIIKMFSPAAAWLRTDDIVL
jgi:hypothetical protein